MLIEKPEDVSMNKLILSMALTLAALCALPGQGDAAEIGKSQTILRNGEFPTAKGSDQFFTGSVRVEQLYPANNDMRSSVGVVTFEPGARSNWHIHPVGQALLVTSGVGLTQEWGKPIQVIRAGDVVICPVNVKHWHGAAPNSAMTHISICEEKEPGKVVVWMEKVTDEQYNAR